MRSTRCLGLALTLAMTLGACEAADSMAPDTEEFATDALDSEIAFASTTDGTADPRAGGGGAGSALFARLAAEIEGFGGLYRNGRCSVVVVLTNMDLQEQAVAIVHDAVAPLVGRRCDGVLSVSAVKGDFTYVQLQRWLSNARPLLEIDGVVHLHIDYKLNRLVITVRSRRVIDIVLEELPRVDVPAEAVVFTGTGGGR